MFWLCTKKKERSGYKLLQLKKKKEYNESMSLVYAEFPSDLPPSMSDEEIEELKKQYRENNRRKREGESEVKGDSKDNPIDEI